MVRFYSCYMFCMTLLFLFLVADRQMKSGCTQHPIVKWCIKGYYIEHIKLILTVWYAEPVTTCIPYLFSNHILSLSKLKPNISTCSLEILMNKCLLSESVSTWGNVKVYTNNIILILNIYILTMLGSYN